MKRTYDNREIMKTELRHMMEHAEALMEATAGELEERITTARTTLKNRLDSTKSEYDKLEAKIMD